jgi:hypothetical protein
VAGDAKKCPECPFSSTFSSTATSIGHSGVAVCILCLSNPFFVTSECQIEVAEVNWALGGPKSSPTYHLECPFREVGDVLLHNVER